MECIYVKEEVIDESECETHPVTDTGDEGSLTVGENVKEEIDLHEELGMDLKRETLFEEGAIGDYNEGEASFSVKRCKQDLKSVVKNEVVPTVANLDRDITIKGKIFYCNECEYKTKQKIHLEEHMRKHTKDLFHCSECRFETHLKSSLLRHKRNKHETDPSIFFYCNGCEFKTKYKFRLEEHKRKHTNDLFQCSECDFNTHAKLYLVQHERNKHETDLNALFYCDECEFKTMQKIHLEDHKRKHTNDLFHCSECRFETHLKSSLVRHNRNKHETDPSIFFDCVECEFKTKYKRNLKEHKGKHTNDLFQCTECDFRTHAKRNLIRHKRNKHEN